MACGYGRTVRNEKAYINYWLRSYMFTGNNTEAASRLTVPVVV